MWDRRPRVIGEGEWGLPCRAFEQVIEQIVKICPFLDLWIESSPPLILRINAICQEGVEEEDLQMVPGPLNPCAALVSYGQRL